MKISMNIIVDNLAGYSYKSYISLPTTLCFDRISFLSHNACCESGGKLYVCRLSQAMSINRSMSSCFICLRDRIQDNTETEEAMRGLIVVNENISIEELYERVQDVFCRIGEWNSRLQQAVIDNLSIQDIIDISESVLQNYVQITDSDFKLLAYTKNIECDDPITMAAREYGYHPEATVKQFRRYHRQEIWEKNGDIIVNDEHEFSPYTMLSKVFKFSNTYFAHAVMTCSHTPVTPGLIDIFRMFMDIIDILVEKDWNAAARVVHVYDSFIKDILDGTLTRRDYAAERARHVNIPPDGQFVLCVTSLNESGRFPQGLISKDIQTELPGSKTVLMDGQIVILLILSEGRVPEQIGKIRTGLSTVMEKYDIRTGISAVFSDIIDAPRAFHQAQLALKYSGRTPGSALLPEIEGAVNGLQRRVNTFEDSYYYILLGADAGNRELWKNSVYYECLKKLSSYDEKHNMNNLQLLYVYLVNESRPTETGEAMHMSRNNVVYRIGRMEEMLDMNLSLPSVRIKLLFSYTMLELYGLD